MQIHTEFICGKGKTIHFYIHEILIAPLNKKIGVDFFLDSLSRKDY
jgi:hypothetical protein